VKTGEDPQRFLKPEKAKAEEDLYMSREEWLKFRREEEDEIWGLLWDLLSHCGLRVHEALELTVAQFDLKRGCVMVQTLKQKKVVFHPVYIAQDDILARVIGLEKQGDEFCFEMNYEKVLRRFKRLAKKAELNERYSPHALRHLQASEMYDTTRDLFAVKERLRHRSIKTTERYAHPSEGTLKDQAAAMRKRQTEEEGEE
jgi:integrase